MRLEGGRALHPGRRRVVLVEATDVRDVLPQRFVRCLRLEVGVDELGPGRGRNGDDAPARRHAIDDHAGFGEVRQEVASCTRGIEPGQRIGSLRSGERDASRVLVGEVEEAVPHPRRHVVERVLGGEREPLALEPLVEVDDVDVLRSALVRSSCDPPGQVLLPDGARDGDELSGLDVRTEDGEVGEPVRQGFEAGHAGGTLARMAPCASMHISHARASPRADARMRSSARAASA